MNIVTLLITLLAFITFLATVTRRFQIPHPVIFIVGGALLSLLPQQDAVIVNPQIVFLLLVAPVLYSTASTTSWRDFKASLLPISLLAFGLVLLTTFTIAWVFKWFMPSMPWSVGCVLGAIISPPDAVAATAITKFVKIPRRTVTVLEGESLINDAVGLILYKFAVSAVVTSTFSLAGAVQEFVFSGLGGVLLGSILGWLILKLISKIDEITITIVISLLTPFIIYILAEKLQLSAVLAVVAAGLLNGWFTPHYMSAQRRLQGRAVWETLLFIINGLAFVLIGLQLPLILKQLDQWPLQYLLLMTSSIVGVLVLVRFFWVFGCTWLLAKLLPKRWKPKVQESWQVLTITAWSGMRGIVSLGAALALPLTVANQAAFPGRDLILFLAFASIVGTLIFQGMTLPFLIKRLNIQEEDHAATEEQRAREAVSKALLAIIHEEKDTGRISELTFNDAYRIYQNYIIVHEVTEAEEEVTHSVREMQALRRKMVKAGRGALLELRRNKIISDGVLRTLQLELDLDELRIQ